MYYYYTFNNMYYINIILKVSVVHVDYIPFILLYLNTTKILLVVLNNIVMTYIIGYIIY